MHSARRDCAPGALRCWAVGLLLIAGAACAQEAASVGPVPLHAQRITAEVSGATLPEAAARLSSLLGMPVELTEAGDAAAGGDAQPKLDTSRRASFSWKNAPVAQALREFCAAYGCGLRRDEDGLLVQPGTLASGPRAQVPGYTVGIDRITFSDYRAGTETTPNLVVKRSLGLDLSIRADTSDPSAIRGLENLRVVDDNGRDVLRKVEDAPDAPLSRTFPSAFPDERLQSIIAEWPYPAPRRLRTIEGDLVVYRSVRRKTFELPVTARQPSPTVQAGDVQLQLVELQMDAGDFEAVVHVLQPPTLDLQADGARAPVLLILEDGSRVPASAIANNWGEADSGLAGYVEISAAGLKSKPVKLLWSAAVRSAATRTLHFRFENYPAELRIGPEKRG